jgi:hypothetical protein
MKKGDLSIQMVVVAAILIIVMVVIILVFRTQISGIVKNILGISEQATEVAKGERCESFMFLGKCSNEDCYTIDKEEIEKPSGVDEWSDCKAKNMNFCCK